MTNEQEVNQLESKRQKAKRRGSAMVASFLVLSMLAVASSAYLTNATETVRTSRRLTHEVTATHLCEAGVQDVVRSLWRPFKVVQSFNDLDSDLMSASVANPKSTMTDTITGVGSYSAGVIRYWQPSGNAYVRNIVVRAVGWVDRDMDGVLDDGEPSRVVDVTTRLELARSQVFDYTYFVNNYGWMDGFRESDLIINGDMRANGNFNFLNGSPTVNGSVYASSNDKLVPRAVGLLNSAPVKMSQASYSGWNPAAPSRISGESDSAYSARVAAYRDTLAKRRRPSYSAATYGADGSSSYENSRDFVYRSDAALVEGRVAGAVVGDSTGIRSWSRTGSGSAALTNLLDAGQTKEVVMPDLSDLARYNAISTSYRDPKATFADGTANPDYNQPAYVEVWNSNLNRYERLSTNGVITGSAVLVGTDARPIKIHGPVTVSQDVVIKGTIDGQGTFYAGRNVHIVGSVRYADGPDFRGDLGASDLANEKKDFMGLAARGSVIMGNPTTFGNPYPLQYMTPVNPPAKTVGTYGRYDENGTWIPPYDAMQVDSSGRRRYQSVVSDSTINNIAEGINQIDAVIYTNFVGGGNLGTGGGGVVFNGTIISKDEAMVTWSLPVVMNYDNRIRERAVSQTPLIDLNLPRSPVLMRSTWQDRGYTDRVRGHIEED